MIEYIIKIIHTFFPAYQGVCPQDLVHQCIACLELRHSENMGGNYLPYYSEMSVDVSEAAEKCFTNINLCLFRRMRDEGSGAWDDDLQMLWNK